MNERSVFLAALEIDDPECRSAYLREACGADANLRRSVEELLHANDSAGSFMDTPAATIGATASDTEAGDDAPVTFLAPSDQPGSIGRLGNYEITRVIGRGGMGIVLEGRDTRLERVVAVKVLAPQLAVTAAARQRFLREAKAAAAVRDEHVVTIYAVEEAAGLPYLVMECIAGLSLQERIDRDGPLELNEILRIGIQTARGLTAAHSHGLIHRDVKPANILLENGVERVKLTDFGLARVADEASLTQSGVIAGTPQYMAPEQAKGEAVDHRADLFSLGSVLYAMCTGRPPFRASTTLGVLKRVCEDPLSPIREINPSIPESLVAVIEKLHAKDPAARYQSAAEVSEVLNGHLAQLQHPSALGQAPVPIVRTDRGATARSRRPLWTAAAVLLCAALLLGLSEAGGVTKLTTSVIRVLTPQGTLIIEVDDPAVKVAVEGDGGLVIKDAGPREVHVPAGKYTVRATKDGQPVKEEIVSIDRGGERTVRVLREPLATTTKVAENAAGAFVLLAAGNERKFDTLAEAVLHASDGDTIEVRGNGPFVTQPIKTTNAINITAGEGFRPVITLSAEASQAEALLQAAKTLVLEGLEFQRLEENETPRTGWHHEIIASKALYAANCRFLTRGLENQVVGHSGPHAIELRNCEFLCPAAFRRSDGIHCPTAAVFAQPERTLVVENCVLTANVLTGRRFGYPPTGAVFRLTHNTFRTPLPVLAFNLSADHSGAENFADEDWTVKTLQVQASDNVFGADAPFIFGQQYVTRVLMPGEAEAVLTLMVGWQGERNTYAGDEVFLRLTRVSPTIALSPPKIPAGLAGWKQLWGTTEEGSVEGQVRFQGGDLLAKAESALEKITPDDFRLREDSAGYRAGPDGRDLGADVDLVGPGPAYERWKKTPTYQEWLKETGQVSGQ